MKGKILVTMAVSAAFLLVGCPEMSKYDTARSTMTYVKTGTTLANSGLMTMSQLQKSECIKKLCAKVDKPGSKAYNDCMVMDHTAKTEYKTCRGKIDEAVGIMDKVYPLAMSIWKGVDAAIDMWQKVDEAKGDPAKCALIDPAKGDRYKACLKGEIPKLDQWMPLLKRGACVVSNALAFMPDKYKVYTNLIVSFLKNLGGKCPTSVLPSVDLERRICTLTR